MILATINSGIWQVNQVLTLTIDYSKWIASTYPKHRIYGFTTTQTLQPTKNNAADLNFIKLRRQAASIFPLWCDRPFSQNNMVCPITQAISRSASEFFFISINEFKVINISRRILMPLLDRLQVGIQSH